MMHLLAQVRLEDVFKSTQDSMNQGPGAGRVLGLFVAVAALVGVLLIVHHRRSKRVAPKTVHSHGKLVKEAARAVGLKSAEVRQLRKLAEEQSAGSPLVVLLCPSLLAKGLGQRRPEERQKLAGVVKKISGQ